MGNKLVEGLSALTTSSQVIKDDILVLQFTIVNAFLVDASDWKGRGVEQSQSERVVRGPREGFTENLDVNIAMLRKIIRNTNLKVEPMKLGRYQIL